MHYIIAKNLTSINCQDNKTISLFAPTGGFEGPCANGGFENGDFTNWQGMVGLRDLFREPITWDPNNQIVNTRHEIVNVSGNWQDPYVNSINTNGVNLGNYIVKLGNDGIKRGAEKLTYCFIVDNSNKDFCFNYAVVLHNPKGGHGPLDLPYFKYFIRLKNNSNGPFIKELTTLSDDPELMKGGEIDYPPDPECMDHGLENIVSKGWACSCTDLSEYLGQEVCVDFITSDCAQGCHFAYAYIDGLCSPLKHIDPTGILDCPHQINCENQVISAEFTGAYFYESKWTISKVGENGNIFEPKSTNIIKGFNKASINDIRALYSELGGNINNCPQKMKLKIDLIGDCGSNSYECDFEIVCGGQDINYCNILVCSNTNSVQMQGDNSCSNCNYNWTPPMYFNNPNAKFPILDLTRNVNVYQQYTVEVNSPEGCKYVRKININNQDLIYRKEFKIFESCKEITVQLILTSEFDMPDDVADVYVKNEYNQTSFMMELDNNNSTNKKKIYTYTFRRSVTLKLRIEGKFLFQKLSQGFENYCFIGNCLNEINIVHSFPKTYHDNFTYPWFCFSPTSFSPNGDGVNDTYFVKFFRGWSRTNCDPNNFTWDIYKSGVCTYTMSIWDRNGGKLYENSYSVSPDNTNGVRGDEIQWNGIVNGQLLNPGVYVVKIATTMVYESSNACQMVCDDPCYYFNILNCNEPVLKSHTLCPSMDENVFAFDLTLVL